ncbi:MAG: hypothetical protein V1707_01775 [bacterium]
MATSWDTIKGNAHAKDFFKSLAGSPERLTGPYLLVGPVGSGKETLARLTASQILGIEFHLLDSHPNWRLFQKDGKTIKVEAVRRWLADVRQTGSGGIVFGLLAGAEQLTEEATNALLKTLEEPPAGVVLFLTATNVSRLLPTLTSRCVVVRLNRQRTIEENSKTEQLFSMPFWKLSLEAVSYSDKDSAGQFSVLNQELIQIAQERLLRALPDRQARTIWLKRAEAVIRLVIDRQRYLSSRLLMETIQL